MCSSDRLRSLQLALGCVIIERTWRHHSAADEAAANSTELVNDIAESEWREPSAWSLSSRLRPRPWTETGTPSVQLLLLALDVLGVVTLGRQASIFAWSRCQRRSAPGRKVSPQGEGLRDSECQTTKWEGVCGRCEKMSRDLEEVLAALRTEQKRCGDLQIEAQETRCQLVAARERLIELGREARVQKAQNDVQVGRLERALKERNGIETERRRAESKLKVLETQRDVDIQTLQDHQEEIRGLKLQLSARVEQETVVQSAHTKPNKESSTGVAVWQKARVFEERIHGKSEAKQATKTNPEDPKSGDGNRDDHNDCGFIVRECRASPRSPNSQMREKLAKARSRVERLTEAKDAEPETEPKLCCEQPREGHAEDSPSSSASNCTASLSPRPDPDNWPVSESRQSSEACPKGAGPVPELQLGVLRQDGTA